MKKGALNVNGYSNISSLTGETESQSTASTSDNAYNDNASSVSSIVDNASIDNASNNDNAPEKKTTEKMVGGRPKGSTDAAAKDLEQNVEEATQEVVKNFKSKKKESRSSKKRLQYGLLDSMIQSSKK